MRFLFVVDLHGDEESYATALTVARERGASAMINGGDLLPHGLRNAYAGQRNFLGWLRGYWAAARDAGAQGEEERGRQEAGVHSAASAAAGTSREAMISRSRSDCRSMDPSRSTKAAFRAESPRAWAAS